MTSSSSPCVFDGRFVPLDGARGPLDKRQIGLVPGAEATVLTLDLPPTLRGQAREQVARRQVQDRIGLDPHSVDMRPLAGLDSAHKTAWTKVLITDPARLAHWRDRAGEATRCLLPDYLALPTAPDLWTLAVQDGALIARLGPDDGFSAPLALAPALLRGSLAAQPKAVLVLGGPLPAPLAGLLDGVAQVHQVGDVAEAGLTPPRVLAHGEQAVNLLHDPQLARAALRRRVLPWRWPLLVGAVAAAVWSAATVLETRQITAETRALNAQTEEIVRAKFVPSGPLLDMRTQVARALAQQRAAADSSQQPISALTLFGQTSDVIAASGATLERANTNAEGGVTLIVQVADFASADALADALRGADLQVELVQSSVRDGSSGVRSEMRVSGGGTP